MDNEEYKKADRHLVVYNSLCKHGKHINKGIMNRISWFMYLRIVFDDCQKVSGNQIEKNKFIIDILAKQNVNG